MDLNNLVISSSLITTLFHTGTQKEDICFRKIKALHFDGVGSMSKPVQQYGIFFETKAIGSGARDSVHDLPRKNNGGKQAVQERLEHQVQQLRFGQIEHFINIVPNVNTQVPIFKRWSEETMLRVTLDIFPTTIRMEDELIPYAAIDLKVTKDLDSDWGNYAWGRPETMDHTQLVMQNYMFRDFSEKHNMEAVNRGLINIHTMEEAFKDLPVFYWVFEYGTKLRNQIFKVEVTDDRLRELKETIRKTEVLIWEQEKQFGWEPCPTNSNCQFCPLNWQHGGLCKEAKEIKII
jgi:hypothetical protein